MAVMNCSHWVNIFISESMKGFLDKSKNSSESCHFGKILSKLWPCILVFYCWLSNLAPNHDPKEVPLRTEIRREGRLRTSQVLCEAGRSESGNAPGGEKVAAVATEALTPTTAMASPPLLLSSGVVRWFQIHKDNLYKPRPLFLDPPHGHPKTYTVRHGSHEPPVATEPLKCV